MTESSTPPASPTTPDGPKPELAGAGLSATGKTADQFHPGDNAPGSTYGDPGGTGTAGEELIGGEPEDLSPTDPQSAADPEELPEGSPS